jgi:type II secretory pathway predicted ATPase ExeA
MYKTHFGFTELPFNDIPNPRFFFSNACNQEAFATLCYGVESRKGFIAVTGEAGTGKSMLLRKLMHDRGPNLRAAYIPNSLVTFTGLLKLAMNDLGLPTADADKMTMIEQLNDYLIRQLQLNRVVCLLIDEAQNLSYEILEEIRLLSNLETQKEKLLQIVLVGQPELERKLDHPNLSQLKQRIALRCRVWPLEAQEVGPYIDMRLETAGYRGSDLFSPEAVERIVLCSKGIPRLVNLICDNALLNAFATSKSRISAVNIQEVTQDLQLSDRPQRIAEDSVSEFKRAVGDDIFRPTWKQIPAISLDIDPPRQDSDYTISNMAVWPVGFDLPKSKFPWRGRVAVLLVIFMMAGAAASLYSQGVTLSVLRGHVEQLADIGREDRRMQSANPTPAQDPQEPTEMESKAQVPRSEVMPASEQPLNENFAPFPDANVTSADRSFQSAVENRAKQYPEKTGEKRRPASDQASMERLLNDENAARRLRIEIDRAIHSRAINGVDVYVRGGTVYLGGQVATQRQKLAAVRATLNVSGVNEVRDRIAVDWAGNPDPGS